MFRDDIKTGLFSNIQIFFQKTNRKVKLSTLHNENNNVWVGGKSLNHWEYIQHICSVA